MNVSYNRLVSLSGIEKFKKLCELNISNNYLTDDQLNSLKMLNKINVLNLSNNNLKTNAICNLLSSLTALEVFINY